MPSKKKNFTTADLIQDLNLTANPESFSKKKQASSVVNAKNISFKSEVNTMEWNADCLPKNSVKEMEWDEDPREASPNLEWDLDDSNTAQNDINISHIPTMSLKEAQASHKFTNVSIIPTTTSTKKFTSKQPLKSTTSATTKPKMTPFISNSMEWNLDDAEPQYDEDIKSLSLNGTLKYIPTMSMEDAMLASIKPLKNKEASTLGIKSPVKEQEESYPESSPQLGKPETRKKESLPTRYEEIRKKEASSTGKDAQKTEDIKKKSSKPLKQLFGRDKDAEIEKKLTSSQVKFKMPSHLAPDIPMDQKTEIATSSATDTERTATTSLPRTMAEFKAHTYSLREWTDDTGSYSVKARFLSAALKKEKSGDSFIAVFLAQENISEGNAQEENKFMIPFEKLSFKDKEYLESVIPLSDWKKWNQALDRQTFELGNSSKSKLIPELALSQKTAIPSDMLVKKSRSKAGNDKVKTSEDLELEDSLRSIVDKIKTATINSNQVASSTQSATTIMPKSKSEDFSTRRTSNVQSVRQLANNSSTHEERNLTNGSSAAVHLKYSSPQSSSINQAAYSQPSQMPYQGSNYSQQHMKLPRQHNPLSSEDINFLVSSVNQAATTTQRKGSLPRSVEGQSSQMNYQSSNLPIAAMKPQLVQQHNPAPQFNQKYMYSASLSQPQHYQRSTQPSIQKLQGPVPQIFQHQTHSPMHSSSMQKQPLFSGNFKQQTYPSSSQQSNLSRCGLNQVPSINQISAPINPPINTLNNSMVNGCGYNSMNSQMIAQGSQVSINSQQNEVQHSQQNQIQARRMSLPTSKNFPLSNYQHAYDDTITPQGQPNIPFGPQSMNLPNCTGSMFPTGFPQPYLPSTQLRSQLQAARQINQGPINGFNMPQTRKF